MDKSIADKLNSINTKFYETLAEEFDSSRSYPWTGWDVLWEWMKDSDRLPKNILDVGCGNGRFLKFLIKHYKSFKYLGIDSNGYLINEAWERYSKVNLQYTFSKQDLLKDPLPNGKFDLIVLFGVIHHIPGRDYRKKLIADLQTRLSKRGVVVFTTWNFMQDKKLSDRIVKWSTVGLNNSDVEEGDYLLDWRRGQKGIRYLHSFGESEIVELTRGQLFAFSNDGKSGDMNSYYIVGKK